MAQLDAWACCLEATTASQPTPVNDTVRVLYFFQYFCTPKGSYGTRAYEFARRWVAAGDTVTVVTSVYDKSDLRPRRFIERLDIEGIDLRVINLRLSNKHGAVVRALTFVAYMVFASWYAVTLKADVVLCSSGPITVGVPGLLAKWLRRRPMVFELRDLFAAGLREMGVFRSRPLLGFLEWLEGFFCRRADAVVAVSPSMADWIRRDWGASNVVSVPNAADNELFARRDGADAAVPEDGVHRVLFTGAMGRANNCGLILDAAAELQARGADDVEFVLIGDGGERAALVERAREAHLGNVRFLPLMPKEELVGWLHRASVGLLVLLPIRVFETVSPNKLFDALAAGLPVVQTTQGWIKELCEREGCGLTVAGDDPHALAEAVLELCRSPGLRRQMAASARRVATQQLDRQLLADRLRGVLQSVAAPGAGGARPE